ncbi:MAG: hypothetical protein J6A88_06000 [Oscillospiraceae bacterium]|nr:hypothetical protein [Oscillospiraceae bacterium]
MKANKSVSLKVVVVLLAVVLLIGCAAGGTIAWLMTDTNPVTNTFSASNIKISLTETPLTGGTATANTYKLIPGKTYAKDPVLTVESTTDVDCWLFFKVEENNPGDYLDYTLNLDGWQPLAGVAGVYYREVKVSDTAKSFYLLEGKTGFANGYVTVSDALTLDKMTEASTASLKFTGYAIQKEGFTDPALAWDEIS